MSRTIAFDVYGTLIDPYGVVALLSQLIGDDAPRIARLWREKQLEYTFRRAAMNAYEDFVVCTGQALDFVCKVSGTELTSDERKQLMAQYRKLPPYAEVASALAVLRQSGHRLYAFSNGHPDDLTTLLAQAGLDAFLDDIVSVHDVQTFKPDPAVYAHFLGQTAASADNCWLVSGNAFDILGAHACGWYTAWVRREPGAVFDTWDANPSIVIRDLSELAAELQD